MRRWVLAVSAVVAVLVVHGVGWWLLSRQVATSWGAWVEAERAQGVSVTCDTPELTGWPLAGGVRVPGLAVSGPGWLFAADQMDVTVQPWAPSRLRLLPSGQQALSAGAFAVRGQARAALLTVQLPAGDDPVWEARQVALETPFGPVTVERASGRVLASESGTELSADLQGVELPPGPRYLLGRSVAAVSLDGSVPGLLPAPRPPDLAAWRDAGGTVRIDAARLQWSTLTATASGTASLDQSLQPLADLHVALAGQDAALDQAVAQGAIQPRAAMAVRAVLGLLAHASPAPGSAAGTLPVSVREGLVSLAGFPVARVPPVSWPAR